MAKSYYTVANLDTGDVLPETWLDQARENMSNLVVPPMALVSKGSFTLTGGSEQSFAMDTEAVDTDGMFTTSGGAGDRFTAQTAGVYHVYFHVQVASTNTLAIHLRSGGTGGAVIASGYTASPFLTVTCSAIVSLAASATVYMRAHYTGGNITAEGRAGIVWIGRTTAP